MRLTPVDRVFTRLGASDRILEGKSTFYVEMEETKAILKSATSRSLAIVDELGRGTSTFDGYSLAHAVLTYMVEEIGCRALYSTHYHMLLDDFRDYRGVSLYHMAYRVKNDHEIMFLYRFERGECPRSFGMNVARMSGIPFKVIDRARQKSERFASKLSELTEKVKEARK
jgi:DNA mismatch repair protein MSH6